MPLITMRILHEGELGDFTRNSFFIICQVALSLKQQAFLKKYCQLAYLSKIKFTKIYEIRWIQISCPDIEELFKVINQKESKLFLQQCQILKKIEMFLKMNVCLIFLFKFGLFTSFFLAVMRRWKALAYLKLGSELNSFESWNLAYLWFQVFDMSLGRSAEKWKTRVPKPKRQNIT